jgi:hypothetical protein
VFFYPKINNFSKNGRVFDMVWKINFSKKIIVWEFKEITIGSWSYHVVDQPQKNVAHHSMGSRRLQHSNIKVFFWMFFTVNFFTPKLMKIKWSSLLFWSFSHHFQIKLSIQGSNLKSIFVSMSELKFLLLTRVLTQNLNIVDRIKFLEKIQKLHI